MIISQIVNVAVANLKDFHLALCDCGYGKRFEREGSTQESIGI
jgi:hypothetical protein